MSLCVKATYEAVNSQSSPALVNVMTATSTSGERLTLEGFLARHGHVLSSAVH